MTPRKEPGPSIKDDKKYEALRDQGYGKEKAARIANDPEASKKGGEAEKYEERTKEQLEERAKDLRIEGYSKMTKDELIKALRSR